MNCKLKQKFQTSQNKMIRFILNFDQRYHINVEDFERLNILPIAYRIQYLNLCMVYNINKGTAPAYMSDNFRKNNSRYTTRNNFMSYMLPTVKSQGKCSFIYNGIKYWNNLQRQIKMIENKQRFKRECKKFLLDEMRKEEMSSFVNKQFKM